MKTLSFLLYPSLQLPIPLFSNVLVITNLHFEAIIGSHAKIRNNAKNYRALTQFFFRLLSSKIIAPYHNLDVDRDLVTTQVSSLQGSLV